MRTYRILLVDDEESVLRSLERVLRSPAYELATASDGASALTILETRPFDLVISDQRMPRMTGTEFLKTVKERHPECVRVMLSGYSDFDSIVSAINEARVSRFLPKPWDNEELLALVADLKGEKEADVPREIIQQLIRSLKTMDHVGLLFTGSPERIDLAVSLKEDADRTEDSQRCRSLIEGCLAGLVGGEEGTSGITRITVTIDTQPEIRYAWEAPGARS